MPTLADSGQVQLVISRAGVSLGKVEIATSPAHCPVPPDAVRWLDERLVGDRIYPQIP